jgi:hypothetical protein
VGKRPDLVPGSLEELEWDPGRAEASLSTVFRFGLNRSESAINWYAMAKQKKKTGAYVLRIGAILAAAVAAVLPLVSQVTSSSAVPPATASIALAIAAVLVAFDRFLDLSKGWIRYTEAMTRLSQMQEAFELDWEAERAKRAGESPDSDQIRGALEMARTYLDAVNELVASETLAWKAGFLEEIGKLEGELQGGPRRSRK